MPPPPPTAPASQGHAPGLATLTPAQAATLPRQRLLAAWGLGQGAPVVWLQGPGGCGKSVALHQWADAQGRSLQVLDARQATATQLIAALKPLSSSSADQAGLPGAPLVCLDHVHAATDPALLAALDQLAERCAEPGQAGTLSGQPMPVLALCSHQPPPPAWAEAQLHGQLRVVPHHELAFTPEEALRLAEQWGVHASHAHALQALTGGWASGMALGLRYVADFPPVGDSLDEVSARLGMIVERKLLAGLPVRTRALLGALCELDGIPAAALDELGFDGQALKRFLHECARDGVLAQWASPCFVLRPLLARAARTQPHATLHEEGAGWPAQIDQALLRSGHWPQALAWRVMHELPEQAAELLQARADDLVASQQGATLLKLAEQLPPSTIDHHPPLRLALIQARMRFDDSLAQQEAAAAWAQWSAQGQHGHALRCAALALWSLRLDMGDARACLPALQRWEHSWPQAGLGDQPPATWPLAELVGSVAHALFDQGLLASAQPWIDALAHRVDAGLAQRPPNTPAQAPSGDDLLAAAFVLTEALYASGHSVEVQSLVDQVMRSPLLQGELATPLLRARWHLLVFDWEMESGLSRYAAQACEVAWQLSAAHGLAATALLSGLGLARLALDRGDAGQAQAHLQACEPFAHAAGSINHLLYLSAHTRAALAGQQFSAAVHAARRALDYAERSDVPRDNHGRWVVDLHHALAAQGQFQASAQVLRDYSPHAQASDHDFYEALACLALALHWRKSDTTRHEDQLGRGMRLAAQEQYIWFFRPLPGLAATLCADALRLGVVPDFVRGAIEARKLTPPDEAPLDWPWPLRIHTLGGVRLVRHGQPVVFSGKVPQRPLDLLCFVACAGPQGADRGTLARQLWEDGEGDIDLEAAVKAMDVALVRLRKLLDGGDALLFSHNGRIGLNPQAVWIDVQQLRQLEAQAQQAQSHRWPALALRVTQDLQALGQGDFLGSDERAPWALAMRQQCRQMFVRAMQATSAVLLEGGQGAAAVHGLESALKLDPIAEPLYQALIRIHLACGQPNDALRVYRRCRDMLSVLTGSAPSVQTTQLKASIDQALPTGQ